MGKEVGRWMEQEVELAGEQEVEQVVEQEVEQEVKLVLQQLKVLLVKLKNRPNLCVQVLQGSSAHRQKVQEPLLLLSHQVTSVTH